MVGRTWTNAGILCLWLSSLFVLPNFSAQSQSNAQSTVQGGERPDGFRDFPPLIEIDVFDAADAAVRRFWLTARGALGHEVPIPGSRGLFCILSEATNTTLHYHSESGEWVFHINFQTEQAAGQVTMNATVPLFFWLFCRVYLRDAQIRRIVL